MSEINFDCSNCGQNLDAPSDMVGVEITCPACEEAILIPGPVAEPEPAPSSMLDTMNGSAGSEANVMQDDDEEHDYKKTATVRIDLPSDVSVPKPKPRIIKIKRAD